MAPGLGATPWRVADDFLLSIIGVHAPEPGSISLPFLSNQENLYSKFNALLTLFLTTALAMSMLLTVFGFSVKSDLISTTSTELVLRTTWLSSGLVLHCNQLRSIQVSKILRISLIGI